MASLLQTEPLVPTAFAPFGDVLDTAGSPDRLINAGRCARFHDRARLDFGTDGRAGISVGTPVLVIVAPDDGGRPGVPRIFLAAAGQGVNLMRGVWHGVLTPLARPGLFAVVDRIGPGANLETFRYPQPFTVV